jgi:hypothetical protein
LRSRKLAKGIKTLLADKDLQGLAGEVSNHPLIKNLKVKKTWLKKMLPLVSDAPSYISGELFTRVLVDIIDPKAKDAQNAAAAIASVKTKLKDSNSTVPEEVRDALLALIDDSTTSMEEFKKIVDSWFDDSMDRVSSWYKRQAKRISLAIAIVLVIAVNADTLRIADRLWKDQKLRVALADQAGKVVETCKAKKKDQKITDCSEYQNYELLKKELK